jgi:hypothetical protein
MLQSVCLKISIIAVYYIYIREFPVALRSTRPPINTSLTLYMGAFIGRGIFIQYEVTLTFPKCCFLFTKQYGVKSYKAIVSNGLLFFTK